MDENTVVMNEDLMLNNLNRAFQSEFVINMLKRNWEEKHNIHFLGNLIGEIYTLHMINKDGYGFEYYMTEMESLYSLYKAKQISPETFDLQKSKIISSVIAAKLGIDVNKQITPDDMDKVKNHFLQEYISNGYVTHSFPDAYTNSIMKDGLIGITEERKDKPHEIQEIQDMFMRKGIAAPLGGYPYYEGSGIYYEHDFTKTFQHSVDSPEWFTWFTSSDHTTAYHSDIGMSPYILRDEEYCRRNVDDLCKNAELDLEETKKVVDFYTSTFNKLSSPILNVALIPKKVVGKDDVYKAVPNDMDLFSSITYVLKDGARQYVEHHGNVYRGIILPNDFKVSTIPSASKYISAGQYSRETKEHLTNLQANLKILKNASDNKSRMSLGMQEKVEALKSKLDMNKDKSREHSFQKEPRLQEVQLGQPPKKFFDQRSQSEINIANQIKQKNQLIKQQKNQQKQIDKPKTLTKSNNSNGSKGFTNFVTLLLIVSVVLGTLFMFIYMFG